MAYHVLQITQGYHDIKYNKKTTTHKLVTKTGALPGLVSREPFCKHTYA